MDFRRSFNEESEFLYERRIEFEVMMNLLPLLAMEHLILYHQQYSDEQYEFLANALYSKIQEIDDSIGAYLSAALRNKAVSLIDVILVSQIHSEIPQPQPVVLSRLIQNANELSLDLTVALDSTLVRVHHPQGVRVYIKAEDSQLRLCYPKHSLDTSDAVSALKKTSDPTEVWSCGHPLDQSCHCSRFSVEIVRACNKCDKVATLRFREADLCSLCAAKALVYCDYALMPEALLNDFKAKVHMLLAMPLRMSIAEWPCIRCNRVTYSKISFLCQDCFRAADSLPFTKQCVQCLQMASSLVELGRSSYCSDCAASLLVSGTLKSGYSKKRMARKLLRLNHTFKCTMCRSKAMACFCKCVECTTAKSRCEICAVRYSKSVKQMIHSNSVCSRCNLQRKFMKSLAGNLVCLACATDALRSKPFPLQYDTQCRGALRNLEERCALIRAFPLGLLDLVHCIGCGSSFGNGACGCLCSQCRSTISMELLQCPNCQQ